MKDLKEFDIPFIGLKEGLHQFEYKIDKAFFDFFDFDEYNQSGVQVTAGFLKKTTLFELDIQFDGTIELACDLTNELYAQEVSGSMQLVIKFGDEFNDENEDILIIPHAEHKINIAQYIYEAIVLAVPVKRIHPGVLDGSLKSPILEKLKELEIENNQEKSTLENDPRWDKLKNLK